MVSNNDMGKTVSYRVNGEVAWTGTLEYVTEDGWAGIRDDSRVDEAPAALVVVE